MWIQKYCQQFLKEVDVALDQSKWHIDKICLGTSQTLRVSSFSFFVFLVYCCLCFCLGRINVSYRDVRVEECKEFDSTVDTCRQYTVFLLAEFCTRRTGWIQYTYKLVEIRRSCDKNNFVWFLRHVVLTFSGLGRHSTINVYISC